ncbi:MAG TPA: efflux RND transporter periplasmic adaptor subunit [Terriglobales bacterium]|jgi:RND family efflux transporter MFP subunit|nr:efflux RND transporter periplasmic adaptor subunit [Terriglobales bacterium]
MASQVPGFATSFTELAMALLSSSEVVPRARLIAQQVAEMVPGSGVVVYTLEAGEEPFWTPRATAGDVAFQETAIPLDSGTLGTLNKKTEPVLFSGTRLRREQYSHLNVRRTIVSLAGLPMVAGERLAGAIEVLSFDKPIHESDLPPLMELARLAALGLAAGVAYEAERNTSLESITRLTQLYDLERSFNSTLEMEDLLPLITSKYQELLKVQGVNLWLVEGEGVRLVSQAGTDNTVEPETVEGAGQGLAGDLAESGQSVIINAGADERLQKRCEGVEEGTIFSLMAAPLMHEDAEVGLVECINKLDGSPFDEDDLFFLTTVNVTASSALHNASLLLAERKVEILETLVSVSQEITSTLNLDKVLKAVVRTPRAVIPYERAALALEETGKLKLRAISTEDEVNFADPNIKRLSDMLQWASMFDRELFVRARGEQIETPLDETRDKFYEYFRDSGARAWYSIPLADETGRVGILSFESSDPDFLSEAHLEMIKVVAGQASVALRNAQMYKEVPFIGLLEPVLEKKRKFLALEKRKRAALVALGVAVLLFLGAFPLPLRLGGEAIVAPVRKAQVMPEVAGVVKKVYVREGDVVRPGTVLADLEDWEFRAALAGAQAKYETAKSSMNRALAANDGTEAGIQRLQVDYWASEVARARERLEKTHLTSPIPGVIATPHVETFVGRRLEFGDSFAEVIDNSVATVDVALEEKDVSLLHPGAQTAVKLDSFPTRTFRGEVAVVSPRGEQRGEERVFYARVEVRNPGGRIRSGMLGKAKVAVGWHSAGYVLFRGVGAWLYSKLWSWFGW